MSRYSSLVGRLGILFLVATFPGCGKKDVAPAAAPPAAPPKAAAAEPVCKEGSKDLRPDGKLKGCTLAQDYVSGPYTCRMNWNIVFHPTGALKECRLASRVEVSGVACADNLELYEDGKLRRAKIAETKTFGDVTAFAGEWVTLHPGGALNRLEIASGTRTLKGFPCSGSENYFHESGPLKKCTLGAPFELDGEKLAAGTILCFDDQGKRRLPCGAMTP